ncbi:glutamate synthase [NADPH] small chain [Vibrio astriarenae]|nr:glutamate synthase [NADPH] small chain [Vibrio sp. C7]
MDQIIALAAALFYGAAIATIIPGLIHQTGIRSKAVLFSAVSALVLHGWLLSDLIFAGSGQNLRILNVASLISFIVTFVLSLSMLKIRVWFLLPVAYGFAIINLLASAFLPGSFITHLEHAPKPAYSYFFSLIRLFYSDDWCSLRASACLVRPKTKEKEKPWPSTKLATIDAC